ncbi:Tkl protein kinase, partial [Globisporangium splendens]
MSNDSAMTSKRVQDVPRALVYAVSRGDVERVQLLLTDSKTNVDGKVNGRTALSHAVERGSAELVRLLVDRGADVTEKDENGRSPLSYAAEAGKTKTVRSLLRRGAEVNEVAMFSSSPLTFTVYAGKTDIVQLLVGRGADVTEKDKNGRSPLSYAAEAGKREIVQIFVDRGADVTEKDKNGRSPLSYAAEAGKREIVQIFVDRGADVTEKDKNGRSPLSYAAEAGNAEIVRLLVRRRADVTKKDKNGRSPLSYAVEVGKTLIVRLLVRRGTEVIEKDKNGRNPLSYAAEAGRTEIVRLLVRRGADVTEKDKNGRSPLSYAAESGRTEIVRLLVRRRADVTEKDKNGRSPLSYAAEAGNTETVRVLVNLGADVTEKDKNGRSPLSYAAEAGKREIVHIFVDRGADVTEKDKNGRSPLSYAAEAGKTEIVRLLVRRGADVTEKDKNGRSPLSYAAESGRTEIVRLLVRRRADVTEKDKNGRSPLSYAAEAGNTETVRVLVDRGADVTEKDKKGRSPLSYAAKSGKTWTVQLLVDRGAEVTEKDKNGRSPLSYAAGSGYSGIVMILIKDGAPVDDMDSNGRTALSYAAQQGYSKLVFILLRAAASPNGTIVWNESQSECETSLTLAGRAGHMNIVKTLIEAGADVDVRAADGETPLISISRWDCAPGVQLLIEKCRSGVNPFATRSTARTPLLRGTLETMHELCTKTHEFAVVTTRVMQRLQDVCSQLEQQGVAGVQSEALATLIPIVFRFCRLLFRCKEQKRLLSRLVSSLAISSAIIDAIEDVKNRFLRVCGMDEPSVPDWFISREDVEFNEWNRTEGDAEITTYEGKWLKTKVIVATSQRMDKNEFQDIADRWYSLSHPNVRKLFGACHIESKPFFVYEYGKRLLDVLIEKQQSPWKYLYDAALGVQLLHQRSIVHGDLRCSNIVVGLDGVAKVGGLEYRMDHYYFWFDTEQAGWASPELLSGQVKSLSSDIYAFGMCILEAITLKRPWFPLELYGYYRNVRRRKLPDRPESFSDDQWDLVTKMCAYKSADRISIGYVVLQFKKFVETRNYLVLVAHDTHIEFPQLELNTIPVKLQTIRDRCQQLPESKWLVRDVWPALEFLFHTMVSQQIRPTDTVAEKYCAALRSLDRYLRTTLSEKSTAHAARSRQVAESHHVIYEELDRLLDMVHVSKSHPIRSWKRSEASIDQRILKDANCVKASAIPGAVSLKMFGLSRTELCDGRTGDEPQAVPTWFLPLRKLQFSSSSEIGQGAFGKVYKGVWLDTPVVVKFMGYEGDRDTISNELFLHEVRVWHRLKKHPHIVELYGACHVDKRYFVCEYASNGDLRDYLKRAGNDHLVWDKLYEIALGLAYMHGLSVVHNDLKCDNVLVGMDGKAKLIDFGLSAIVGDSEIMVDPKLMGAIHWKSPEYLAGGRPSFASDVYSFAMCILEAVTGDIPWGNNAIGAVVKYRWNLIELMTKQNPSERVRMTFVVDKLFEISEAEKSRAAAGPGVPLGWEYLCEDLVAAEGRNPAWKDDLKRQMESLLPTTDLEWRSDGRVGVYFGRKPEQMIHQLSEEIRAFWPSFQWNDNPWIIDSQGEQYTVKKVSFLKECNLASSNVRREEERVFSLRLPTMTVTLTFKRMTTLRKLEPRSRKHTKQEYKWISNGMGTIIAVPVSERSHTDYIQMQRQANGVLWTVTDWTGDATCQQDVAMIEEEIKTTRRTFKPHQLTTHCPWLVHERTPPNSIQKAIDQARTQRLHSKLYQGLGGLVDKLNEGAKTDQWNSHVQYQLPADLWKQRGCLTPHQMWTTYRISTMQLNLFHPGRIESSSGVASEHEPRRRPPSGDGWAEH